MTGTDAEIARNVRREFGKRPVDATRLDVQVTNGRITLGGTLAHLRSQPNISLQAEIELIERILLRDRLVKEVYNQVNFSRAHEHAHETTIHTRGRSGRHGGS